MGVSRESVCRDSSLASIARGDKIEQYNWSSKMNLSKGQDCVFVDSERGVLDQAKHQEAVLNMTF